MKVYTLNYPACSYANNRYQQNFNGYHDVIGKAMRTPVKDTKNAQEVFTDLINEIHNDKSINKTNFFKTVYDLFKQNGLIGLFSELKKAPNKDSYTECMLEYARKNNVLPLAKDENEIFDIVSYSGSADDIHLGFLAGKEKGGIEFYTDKKGDLFVEQTHDRNFLNTGFYSDTGTKKVEVTSYAGGKPDKTFYNKDGSKPFFKNWFLGGTPVEGIY